MQTAAPGWAEVHAWVGPERFFANGQGGFRVACPVAGSDLTGRFPAALEAWRGGGPRRIGCECGREHELDTLRYRPAAAFASAAVECVDPPDAELPEAVAAAVAACWPGLRQVLRRG